MSVTIAPSCFKYWLNVSCLLSNWLLVLSKQIFMADNSSTSSALVSCESQNGNSISKQLPSPSSLVKVILPPIISVNCPQIAKPSPVPPNFRVVDRSAWVKGVNNFCCCAWLIPMPLSITLTLTVHT